MLEYGEGNIEIFRALKKEYSEEEWSKKREEIFKKLPKTERLELYKEEGLYDRLLSYVIQIPGLQFLQKHEKVLGKKYPEQVIQKYRDELNKAANFASDRSGYKMLVSQMRRMMKIEGGEKVCEELLAEWGRKYKRRPAMIDELNKL